MRSFIRVGLILTASVTFIFAKENVGFKPTVLPKYYIQKTTEKIEIDAKLDEATWKRIEPATDFAETNPNDNTKPPVKTEVFLAYDEENLYVAFKCYDDPDKIRYTWRDRDKIWQEDYMGIILDTYGQANWSYFIAANPLGIQGDTRISSTSGEDVNFDLIFESKGRITEDGYIIEMAIPFSSLRFPDKNVQNWRVNFWRTRPHESRATYSWASISRDNPCWMCQFGYLKGVENVKPGSSIDFIPTIIGGQSQEINDYDDPGSGLGDVAGKNTNLGNNADFGATLKWAVTPSLTLEGTYNPDFSQVESDAAQVDINQTFALFYPERRPFFQEGSDLFRTWINAVYTRTINDPIGATKAIGRWEKATVAYMGAVDENTPVILPFEERSEFVAMKRSLSNIFRYRYNFGNESHIGALVTDRRWMSWETYDHINDSYSEVSGDGSGSLAGIDAKYRFWDNYTIEAQFLSSYTVEPNDTTLTEDFEQEYFANGKYTAAYDGESFGGTGFYASLERDARHWNFDLNVRSFSPTFRSGNGFIPQNDFRRYLFWNGYMVYFEDTWIERFMPSFHTGFVENYNGEVKDKWLNLQTWFRFAGQNNFEISYMWNDERFKGYDFKDINRVKVFFNTNFSEILKFGFFLRTGFFVGERDEDKPVRAKGIEVFELWSTIRPWDRLVISPSYIFSDAREATNDRFLFQVQILRAKFDLQIFRELTFRLIAQYVDYETPNEVGTHVNDRYFSFEPLIYYKLNPFSVFYLGTTSNLFDYSGGDWKDFGNPGWTTTSQQVFVKFQYLFNI